MATTVTRYTRATQRQDSNLHRPQPQCVEIGGSIQLSYAADALTRTTLELCNQLTLSSAQLTDTSQ
jgi:hypothetical protein